MSEYIKPVADSFINRLMLDLWPDTAAQLVDFGFTCAEDKDRLYAAYKRGIKTDKISDIELSNAAGDGPALTELVQRVDFSLVVTTDYDD